MCEAQHILLCRPAVHVGRHPPPQVLGLWPASQPQYWVGKGLHRGLAFIVAASQVQVVRVIIAIINPVLSQLSVVHAAYCRVKTDGLQGRD